MKKLNRKGFTLIELLAVIVILAIIVVVTVPTIINTIADARVQSIWNLAGSTANSYDTMKAQDLLATNKVLAGKEATKEWQCISDELAKVLDLSSTDLVFGTTTNPPVNSTTKELNTASITRDTCSAIRLNSSGGAEVLLVAKAGGKFDVSGNIVWALSTLDEGKKTVVTTE